MFSFRTTSLEEQLDKALHEGKVGCFCTQNCWDTERGRYMYDIFRERGNLAIIFNPRDTELTPQTNHIEFSTEDLKELNAVVVEIQDVGARYFNYTKDVFRLMDALKDMTPEEIIDKYQDDTNRMGKIELAGMTLLKISDEMADDQLLLKSKLRQNGIQLLKYIQTQGNTFSIQRVALIQALERDT